MTNATNRPTAEFSRQEGSPIERELIAIARREARLRATREGVASVEGADVTPLTNLLASESVTLRPLFGISEERIQARTASLAAEAGAEVLDLSVYHKVEAPDERLEELTAPLRGQEVVEAAYVKPPVEPPVALNGTSEMLNDMVPSAAEAPPVSPDFTARQAYLDAAPGGIDARYEWTPPSGGGAGVRIVDVEGAWRLLIGLCFWLFQQKGWIPLVPRAIALAGTGASVVAYSAQQARRQQQMVMRLLGQSTSPEIAETLWQSRETLLKHGKLPEQKLIATLLFTDLRGFSTISENMPPEALLEWLNEYLEELTQIVQTHQGIVNKFTGDGIMAAFGVPIPRQDPQAIAVDAQRAVACALEMEERLKRLNTNWQQRGLPSAQMRVGIFTGPIVAGSLGARRRLGYGLIGNSVNIASRLESVDKHRQPNLCRILIAQETLTYLQGQFIVEPWGLMTLKGKEQAVSVFHIIGPKIKNKVVHQ